MPRRDRAFGVYVETGRAKGNKRRTPCREKSRKKRYGDRRNDVKAA